MSRKLDRLLAKANYSPDGGLPEDTHHERPVGMGRKRYGKNDDSPLVGLSHELHMRIHAQGEEKALEGIQSLSDFEDIC